MSQDDDPDGEAAGCCDHLGCPFVVVYMVADVDRTVRASVYSSETNAWSAPSPAVHVDHFFDDRPSLLAGGALHFSLVGGKSIVKYNLVGHRLLVIDTPPPPAGGVFAADMVMTKAKDGGLGFVAVVGGCVYLWTRTQPTGGWAQHKVMEELETLLPKRYRRRPNYHWREVIGLAEGTNTIFIDTGARIFALDLKSRQARIVGDTDETYSTILPYMCFYTPGRRI